MVTFAQTIAFCGTPKKKKKKECQLVAYGNATERDGFLALTLVKGRGRSDDRSGGYIAVGRGAIMANVAVR